MVDGARPSARIVASQASSSSFVAAPTGLPSDAPQASRSRRYASTVLGERRPRGGAGSFDVGIGAIAHRGGTRFGGVPRPAAGRG